jgi:hypothetical protein
MNKFVIASAALAILAVPALAQFAPAGPDKTQRTKVPQTRLEAEARIKDRLVRMDSNRDGAVTREERRAHVGEVMKEHQNAMFAAMDADNNGSVNRAEFDAHRERRIATRGEGKRERRMAMRGFADADGRIVIADAVKKALERFDAADANRDGTLTPEERRTAREAMRSKWRGERS